MSLESFGGILAVLLPSVAAVVGYTLKRRSERQAAIDAAAKEKADREEAARQTAQSLAAKQAQEAYDQMQEDLAANRAQMTVMQENMAGLQRDLTQARDEQQKMWSRMSAMTRVMDAQEAHINDVHRWDENGRNGPMPQRKSTDG